uniref:Uncharacterized protein n=1 Tax=Timema douglasi TaxID=61478 RepID=A0A7R8ZCA6_TIMDO|nr:unnamed protein product [Timema douglasi]
MTNLLLQPSPSRGDTFPRSLIDSCRTSIVPRYGRSEDSVVNTEMKHSKSDDLVLQSSVGALVTPECHHARCDSPIPKTGSVVYEDDLVSTQYVLPKAKYFSDSEADSDTRPSILDKSFSSDSHRTSARHVGLYDQVDPEDSIRDMITENDFYRFVLFKRHYDKYLHLSHKYEEARNIAYYLEEKYHEIKQIFGSTMSTNSLVELALKYPYPADELVEFIQKGPITGKCPTSHVSMTHMGGFYPPSSLNSMIASLQYFLPGRARTRDLTEWNNLPLRFICAGPAGQSTGLTLQTGSKDEEFYKQISQVEIRCYTQVVPPFYRLKSCRLASARHSTMAKYEEKPPGYHRPNERRNDEAEQDS